jgi:hypothetical protein
MSDCKENKMGKGIEIMEIKDTKVGFYKLPSESEKSS